MIEVIFEFAGDYVLVRVDGFNCLFRTKQFGGALAPLDALQLDKKGVIKEFPDLKDNEDWKKEAIKRFKENIKKMDNEDQRIKYIIEDLKKFGYKPMYYQKQGYRKMRIK